MLQNDNHLGTGGKLDPIRDPGPWITLTRDPTRAHYHTHTHTHGMRIEKVSNVSKGNSLLYREVLIERSSCFFVYTVYLLQSKTPLSVQCIGTFHVCHLSLPFFLSLFSVPFFHRFKTII